MFRAIVLAFFAYGAVVLLLTVVTFMIHSPADFSAAYAQYFPGGVAKVFSDAAAKGYMPGTSLVALGAVVPLLFVSIGPYPVMQMVGSEIKNPAPISSNRIGSRRDRIDPGLVRSYIHF